MPSDQLFTREFLPATYTTTRPLTIERNVYYINELRRAIRQATAGIRHSLARSIDPNPNHRSLRAVPDDTSHHQSTDWG